MIKYLHKHALLLSYTAVEQSRLNKQHSLHKTHPRIFIYLFYVRSSGKLSFTLSWEFMDWSFEQAGSKYDTPAPASRYPVQVKGRSCQYNVHKKYRRTSSNGSAKCKCEICKTLYHWVTLTYAPSYWTDRMVLSMSRQSRCASISNPQLRNWSLP